MEMLEELETMIQTYSAMEKDFLIIEFIEELEKIKESVFLTSKN